MVAFVDDLIFFLSDPLVSLPKLLHSVQTYGTLSNFQINLSKSSDLPTLLDQAMVDSLHPSFPFRSGARCYALSGS